MIVQLNFLNKLKDLGSKNMNKLAIHGGQKVKSTPFGTGKRFGEEEKEQLMLLQF